LKDKFLFTKGSHLNEFSVLFLIFDFVNKTKSLKQMKNKYPRMVVGTTADPVLTVAGVGAGVGNAGKLVATSAVAFALLTAETSPSHSASNRFGDEICGDSKRDSKRC
jgi:hypothetical protein